MEVDGRADIYSLGIIFYEMLTGERPYVGDSPIKIIMQHLQKPIPVLEPELARFQPLLDRLLCKDRNGRFADAAAMVDYMLDVHERESINEAGGPVSERGTKLPERRNHWRSKRTIALAFGGMVSLSVGFTGIYLYSESLKNTDIVVRRTDPASTAERPGGIDTLAGVGQESSAVPTAGRKNIKREDVMKALRWLGQHSLQQGRLTSPPADNAYYYFSRLLALDGKNKEAMQGFELIAERYIALAERQYTQGNSLQAQVYITLGLQVNSDNEGLLALQAIIKDHKRSIWDSLTRLFSGP